MNWSICLYETFYFIPDNIPFSEVYFDIKIVNSDFFLLVYAWYTFSFSYFKK